MTTLRWASEVPWRHSCPWSSSPAHKGRDGKLWFECKAFPTGPRVWLDALGSFGNVQKTNGSLQEGGTLGSLEPSRSHEKEGSEAPQGKMEGLFFRFLSTGRSLLLVLFHLPDKTEENSEYFTS